MLVKKKFLQKYHHKWIVKQANGMGLEEPVVPLEFAKDLPHLGNKAQRMGELLMLGISVPDGFVITEYADIESDEFVQCCTELFRKLQLTHVGVRRSPMFDEDGDAGNCKCILNVSRSRIGDAVEKIRESMQGSSTENQGSVVVQKMINAQYSGCIYSEHPCNSAQMLVKSTDHAGGIEKDLLIRFGKYSFEKFNSLHSKVDFTALLRLALKIEKYFGRAQEIDWVYRDNSFLILQSKDITPYVNEIDEYRDRLDKQRLEALDAIDVKSVGSRETILYRYDHEESRSCPAEVSWGLLERIYAYDGSIHRSFNKLSLKCNISEVSRPWLIRVFGHVYIHKKEANLRAINNIGFISNLYLHKRSDSLKYNYLNGFLPHYIRRQRNHAALKLRSLEWCELTEHFSKQVQYFINTDFVEANVIYIATEIYVATAIKKLSRINRKLSEFKLKDDEEMMPDVYAAIEDAKEGNVHKKRLIKAYGHRALHDFELSEPRYHEQYETLKMLASVHLASLGRENSQLESLRSGMQNIVVRALEFQALKEATKHYTAISLSEIRRTLLEIDRRLGLNNNVFHLTLNELLKPNNLNKGKAIKELTKNRKDQYEKMKNLVLAQKYSCLDLENTSVRSSLVETVKNYSQGVLTGERVSGSTIYQGKVRFINTMMDLNSFEQGDILVAKSMSRQWLEHIDKIGGVILEGVGLSNGISHIQKNDIPCIVCADDAMERLSNGQEVVLLMTGAIDRRLQAVNKGKLTYNALLVRDRRKEEMNTV